MHYNTAIRSYTSKRIEEIESADILVGIPSYNNEKTIAHVIQMVTHGLAVHYKDRRCVIFVADGGHGRHPGGCKRFSSEALAGKNCVHLSRSVRKGTALRSVFEAAARLQVKACAVVDSDLRSITPDWVQHLLDPVVSRGYQFVAPVYLRHKYDATITNNIVYNLTAPFTEKEYGSRSAETLPFPQTWRNSMQNKMYGVRRGPLRH